MMDGHRLLRTELLRAEAENAFAIIHIIIWAIKKPGYDSRALMFR